MDYIILDNDRNMDKTLKGWGKYTPTCTNTLTPGRAGGRALTKAVAAGSGNTIMSGKPARRGELRRVPRRGRGGHVTSMQGRDLRLGLPRPVQRDW